MDPDFKNVIDRLATEVKKDLPFFGICGAVVGYFMVLHSRLEEEGIAHGVSWADSLFSDFVSFNAFGLVFVGVIAVGSVSTIATCFGIQWPKLEAVVQHLETRLAQISSSIISFTLGLSALALVHSFMTISVGGLKLALSVVLFNGLLFVGFCSAVLMARRTKPWGTWWAASLSLIFAVASLVWFIVKGAK